MKYSVRKMLSTLGTRINVRGSKTKAITIPRKFSASVRHTKLFNQVTMPIGASWNWPMWKIINLLEHINLSGS